MSNRPSACSMSKTELLTSIASPPHPRPMVSTPFCMFSARHCWFSYCWGSICISHSWIFSSPKNLHLIQHRISTVLPSKHVLNLLLPLPAIPRYHQLSQRLMWLSASQLPLGHSHCPQSMVSFQDIKNRNQIMLLSSSKTSEDFVSY